VVKVKGGGRVESALFAMLRYPLYKYIKYIILVNIYSIREVSRCESFNTKGYSKNGIRGPEILST